MDNRQIMDAWQDTGRRLTDKNIDIDLSLLNRRMTALDELRRFYRRFATLGFVMAAVSLIWLTSPLIVSAWRIPLVIIQSAYFLLAAIMDTILFCRVSAIDVLTMPVGNVAAAARKCRRFHHLCMAILLPFAACLVTVFYFAIGGGYFAIGIFVGAVVGIAIGINVYLDIMRSYRYLTED